MYYVPHRVKDIGKPKNVPTGCLLCNVTGLGVKLKLIMNQLIGSKDIGKPRKCTDRLKDIDKPNKI